MQKLNISLNAIFTLLLSIIIGVMFYGAISPNQAYTLIAAILLVTMLYSLYAVIKTGASYIPMDINYPKERLLYMLDETQSPLIVATGKSRPPVDCLSSLMISMSAPSR